MPVVHVVDDDASFLVALARLLKASGYAVQTYASAADFLARLGDGAGCVITDLRMPGMDGLDLQQALARGVNMVPVVFLSGAGDIPTTVQAMRQGAEDFLTKRRAEGGDISRRWTGPLPVMPGSAPRMLTGTRCGPDSMPSRVASWRSCATSSPAR
jgi:CheY-like chemotaxis protein